MIQQRHHLEGGQGESLPAAMLPALLPDEPAALVAPDGLLPVGLAAVAELPVAVEGPVAALVGVSGVALEVGP